MPHKRPKKDDTFSIDTGPALQLRVVHPKGEVTLREFDRFPVRLGREPDNEIHLDDVSVSRRHAEIYQSGERIFVRDLKSLNGLRLNGETTVDAQLSPGDCVTVGIYELQVVEPKETEQFLIPITRHGEDLKLRPEGTEGVLEIIRAVDVEKILKRDGDGEDLWNLSFREADQKEHMTRLHHAYTNLLAIMNLVSSVGNYSHPHQIVSQFAAALKKCFPNVDNIVVIELAEGEEGALRIIHQDVKRDNQSALSQPSRTILKRVIEEMTAMYAVDARRDPRFENSDSIRTRGVRSMMCAPLVARGAVVGAVYAENLNQPYCYTSFDLNLLTVFAFHLAVAIEMARLLEERDKAFERAASNLKAAKQDKIALILQYSQSEKKFRALFEQSALGAAVINLVSRRIEEVNDGLVRMLGYTRRQLAEMDYARLFPEAQRDEAARWLTHVRETAEGSAKTVLETSTGALLITLQSCRALRLGDSEVMVAYFIDITAKERAEEETQRQLRRVMALSELSQSLMTTLNTDAIHELLFRKMRSVVPLDHISIAERGPEDGENFRLMFTATVKNGETGEIEHTSNPFEKPNPLVRQVLVSNEPVIHFLPEKKNPAAEAKPFGSPGTKLLRSSMFVPMASRHRLVGLVCIQSNKPEAYDESHQETVRAMVAQAAMALSNARAFEAIRKQEENLRQLSLQIMTAQETERGRISRELHDGVGQQLTAMKYILEGIRNAARGKDEEKLLNRINEARELATQIISDLRGISLDLRPTMLDDLGLKPTLEWFTRQYAERYEIGVVLECEVEEAEIPSHVATATYRIIQEAMGNVAKHAKAKRVVIDVRSDTEALRVQITDDGVGFDMALLPQAQKTRGCSGMLNMKERVHFLGGDFRLETAPGKGTKLTLAIPVKETTD
jgi:PAS domain S-box-containing protein